MDMPVLIQQAQLPVTRILIAALLALGLGLVPVLGGRLHLFDLIHRKRALSAAGGASVAYVFVHLLPSFARWQSAILSTEIGFLSYLERHAYLVALLGLVTVYGLEQTAQVSRERGRTRRGHDATSERVFWLHIGFYSFYSAIIGYLLLYEEGQTWPQLLFYWLAMAMHFLVLDSSLRDHHKQAYHDMGRWILGGR
ncbi:MAG: hypothetical protein ACYC5M_14910 [Anaerolineae bacterium]